MKIENYLGIDWGGKRIGLALGSGETKLALPFKTAYSLQEVLAVVRLEEIEAIVLGDPRKMSGEEAKNKEWSLFWQILQKKVEVPIFLQDERLSSKAVDALEGTKREKVSRDEMAAALILQSYFDSH